MINTMFKQFEEIIKSIKSNRDLKKQNQDLDKLIKEISIENQDLRKEYLSYKEYYDRNHLSNDEINTILLIIKDLIPDLQNINKNQENLIKFFTSNDGANLQNIIKLLQLIGFNFKEAIGQPLTNAISKKVIKYFDQ